MDKYQKKLAVLILEFGMKTTVGEIMEKKKKEPDFFLNDMEKSLGKALRRQPE